MPLASYLSGEMKMKQDGLVAALFFAFLIWFFVAALKVPGYAETKLNVQNYIEMRR
jgi:hypothetical protein